MKHHMKAKNIILKLKKISQHKFKAKNPLKNAKN